MNTHRVGYEAIAAKFRRLRSMLSAKICRRVAATLGVLLIAFAALAATSSVRHTPAGHAYSAGGNLMLAPGRPGLEPAFY